MIQSSMARYNIRTFGGRIKNFSGTQKEPKVTQYFALKGELWGVLWLLKKTITLSERGYTISSTNEVKWVLYGPLTTNSSIQPKY